MRETDPQVELIARPQIDVEALGRYLKTVGGERWLDARLSHEETNPGEMLVEAAGRACYRSWEPGLNPNVKRIRSDQKEYFLNILRSGHGSVLEHANYTFVIWDVSRVFCYDEDTEVLTSEGWVPFPKVSGRELFGTLNPDTGELEYQLAEERFVGRYSGPMYRVRSEQIDLLVTPNHRMWVQKHDTRAARRKEERYRIFSADEIAGKRVKYMKTALWRGENVDYVEVPATYRGARKYAGGHFPAKPFARFLGYYLSEGFLNEHRIVICQNRGAVLDRIAATVRAIGLHPYIPPQPHRGKVVTGHPALRDFLEQCGSAAHNKRVPEMVGRWSPELIREFLAAMIEGDGCTHKTNGHQVIYTSSSEMADDLQVLAIKAGRSANVRVDDRVGLKRVMPNGQVFHNIRPFYIVSLVKKRTHPLVNHNGRMHDCFVDYDGDIHCVKVPNGLLFVRRNGKPVVSGNTHELVRHRAGSAFSQESMRFVRVDDIGFRIPESMEPMRTEIIEILETLEDFQIKAAERFGLDEEGVPFHTKKEMTSAMRRLAPEGISTMIVWTANVRTLRHVIQARTDPGAEEELRYVFHKIGKIMAAEAPLLFGDFVVEDGAWKTEHKKV